MFLLVAAVVLINNTVNQHNDTFYQQHHYSQYLSYNILLLVNSIIIGIINQLLVASFLQAILKISFKKHLKHEQTVSDHQYESGQPESITTVLSIERQILSLSQDLLTLRGGHVKQKDYGDGRCYCRWEIGDWTKGSRGPR